MEERDKFIKFLCFVMGLTVFTACEGIKEGEPAYHLAQNCVSIQPALTSHFLTLDPQGRYRFQEVEDDDPQVEKFFLKPSGLGSFLLQDRQKGLLSSHHRHVSRVVEAGPYTEWEIFHVEVESPAISDEFLFSLRSLDSQHRLVEQDGRLALSAKELSRSKSEGFRLVPSEGCTAFPEAALDATVSPQFYQPQASKAAVKGFVDFHSHLAFSQSLATVAMSGDTFHRYGIKHAMASCSSVHGDDGQLDLLDGQHANPGSNGHSTEGYPHFTYWPNRKTASHITAYYMWIKRAYLSGLRLLVTNVTGNPSFCQVLGLIHLGKAQGTCNSQDSLERQIQYIYQMQDYIDAQEGGPGRGWFRIATSSKDARTIIEENKLAVVLGSEYGSLFDCRRGDASCSQAYISRKLDEIYAMGVRSVFPIHRFDNAFGGTRPQEGAAGSWMHLTSKFSTSIIDSVTDLIRPSKALFKEIQGYYWDLEECTGGISGTIGIKSMKAFIQEDFKFLLEAAASIPLIGAIAVDFLNWSVLQKLEPLPEYEELQGSKSSCNRRPLQPSGYHLLQALMDRGMIIEVDHMSYPTLMDTLAVLEDRNYPGVVSSHSWIENQQDIRRRIFSLGGIMAPMNNDVVTIASLIETYGEERRDAGFIASAGIGTDIQGVAAQAPAHPNYLPQYPFTSWDGLVEFHPPKTGYRAFNYAREGMAHYGLLPEWVESLRLMDLDRGTKTIETLMMSAEAYLQMWQQAESSSSMYKEN